MSMLDVAYRLLDKGLIPDFVLRHVIRVLLRQRLHEIDHGSFEANHAAKMLWIEQVRTRDNIAESPEKPNEQHYEVPTKFILSTLGPLAKYSSCLYPTGKESLAEAEVCMLESYCEKAKLEDGQEILDLGCGWGSLSIYLAQKYPNSKITGISNSASQKEYIDETARSHGFSNIKVITADINTFHFEEDAFFDRILSIEMFEHMKNYQLLFQKISTWLRPKSAKKESLLFVQVFCHRTMPYHFQQDDGWMAQNFFSGGTMPSHDLFAYFQSDMILTRSWYIRGTHYSRTCEDWLKCQDMHREEGLAELRTNSMANGKTQTEANEVFNRFRVFYIACSELFNMNNGQLWGIGHYLFKIRDGRTTLG